MVKNQSKGFSRSDRVSEQIRRELSELLQFEIKDPRVKFVSLTDVELTPDYAHAKVYFTTLQPADKLAEVERGLKAAAGFLRRELGRRVRIHTTPELHFVHDESVERGVALSKLIDEAAAQAAPDDENGQDAETKDA